MIELSVWIDTFLQRLDSTFGERVWFVGLQGSYARGEATKTSDIDMVVILDTLCVEDIDAYNAMLDTLPHRELICGFLSGKDEILNWETSDLFQFYFDTKPLIGSLDGLLTLIDRDAIERAVKVGACNLYHGCVHNMLYEKSDDILRGLYKSASFVIQAVCYLETGRYIKEKQDLLLSVLPEEQVILNTHLHLKDSGDIHFKEMSETLFEWCQNRISKYN